MCLSNLYWALNYHCRISKFVYFCCLDRKHKYVTVATRILQLKNSASKEKYQHAKDHFNNTAFRTLLNLT